MSETGTRFSPGSPDIELRGTGVQLFPWKAAVLLAALTILFFYQFFFRGQVLYWGDVMLQAYPWRHFIKMMLCRGELPLWNPYIFCGLPFVANPQPGTYYPISLLTLPLAVPVAITLDAALHVFLAGMFMFLYLRHRKRSDMACLIGAIGFMFGGFLITKLQFMPIFRVIPWMPLVFWRLERVHDACLSGWTWSTLREMLLLSLVLALQWIGGHLQVSILLWLFYCAYAVVLAFTTPRAGGLSPRVVLLFRVILSTLVSPTILMLGLTALQWLPALELMRMSTRTEMTFTKAMEFSLPPWQIITLLIPHFYGSPQFDNYWGAGNNFEMNAYAGVLILLLAAFGALWGTQSDAMRKDAPVRLFWIVMSVAGIMLACGGFCPVYRALYHWIPLFRMFRAPARFLLWYAFSVPCLAALGWDALWGVTSNRLRVVGEQSSVKVYLRWLKWIGIASIIALLVLLLAYSPASRVFEQFVRFCFEHTDKSAPTKEIPQLANTMFALAMLSSLVFLMFYFLSYAALLMCCKFTTSTLRVQGFVIAVLIADSFVFGVTFNPFTSDRVFDTHPQVGLGKGGLEFARERVLLPLESINRLWRLCYGYGGYGRRDEEAIRTPLRYSLPNVNMAQGIYNAEGYDAVRYLPYERVLRRCEREMARATPAPCPQQFNLPAHIIITAPEPATFDKGPVLYFCRKELRMRLQSGKGRSIPQWQDGHNTVRFATANVPQGAVLRLDDVCYPGWRASVNGCETAIRADGVVVRLLDLPRGDCSGEFVYYPNSFKFGLFVTLCFVGGLAAAISALHTFQRRLGRRRPHY